MHVHKTTFDRTALWGTHHVVWKGKQNMQTKKVDWKNGSVKHCWVNKVHDGLGENGEY